MKSFNTILRVAGTVLLVGCAAAVTTFGSSCGDDEDNGCDKVDLVYVETADGLI